MDDARASDGRSIARARAALLIVLATLAAIAITLPFVAPPVTWLEQLALVMSRRQDLPLVPLVIGVAALVRFRPMRERPWPSAPDWVPWAAAVLLVLLCWWGHHALLAGFDLSRDEQMADFDAAILRRGHLFAPIPIVWRPYAAALNQTFILPIGAHEAWVSAYLPGNALLRTAVGLVTDPALTSPLLAGIGAVALWRIAARLWPDAPNARIVAVILYLGSAQIVLTAMTAYAMSAHLALNLIWLALFLRGRAGHAGAIAIGFVATGLHQPLFHPLFVAPFLLMLLQARRWRLLAAYTAAYLAIGLFWLGWPHWISAHGIAAPPPGPEGIGYGARLIGALTQADGDTAWLMAANLLRFATWQHLLLLPLLATGIVAGRGDPLLRALMLGLALPVLAMTLLLPVQGHGWGYRYLHGVEGNACLIAAAGWRWLAERGRAPVRALGWTSAATLLGLMPLHAWTMHHIVAPLALLDAQVRALPVDLAIIDDRGAPLAKDVVRNDPWLTNRPLRLAGSELTPAQVIALCRGRSIGFVAAPALAPYARMLGTAPRLTPTPHQMALKAAARLAGCALR